MYLGRDTTQLSDNCQHIKRTLLRGFARTIPVGAAGITTLENNAPNTIAERNTQRSNEKLIRDTKFILQSPEYPRASQTVYPTHWVLRDTPIAQNDNRRAVLNPRTRTQRLDERAIPRLRKDAPFQSLQDWL